MHGKILKISSNDLYGNVDDRKVSLFVAFTHKKYMNKYAIFTFTEEFNKKKLYLASIHLKPSSIVTFSIRNDEIDNINKFIDEYLNNSIDESEYEIIDISKITKIELVSNTSIDFDKLKELDDKSIPKIKENKEVLEKKKPVFLYLLLAISILSLIGIIYLHYNPESMVIELPKLDCTISSYNDKLDMPYTKKTELKFDTRKQLRSINTIDTYTFDNKEIYEDFKNNNKESTYFDFAGTYKYDDDALTLKVMYEEIIIITNYNEIERYMKKQGYTCIEGKYNE